MATIRDTYIGAVCQDCILIHANGPLDDEDANRAYAEGMAGFPADTPATLDADVEDPHFSDRPCLICDTPVAGDRFDATVTLFDN